MEQVTALMDQTIASASEMGDVKWLTKSQLLARQQYTEGIASERERLSLRDKAFEDARIEQRGSHANPAVAVSLPAVTRA
eukprot:4872411-Prorocentrum_lima.AAC.1